MLSLSRRSGVERMVAAADQHVRLDADLAELRHRLLGRLGLQLARRRQEGHQRHVDEDHVLRLHLEGELAHGLEEGQALDVAGRAADLGDQDVDVLAAGVDPLLDLVGDVRDHLDGLAEVDPAPLLLDHALVDLARAQAVEPGKPPAGEALVVAEIEVGLRAVLQHVHLPVLVRAHRARIDVEIRVELLDPDRAGPGAPAARPAPPPSAPCRAKKPLRPSRRCISPDRDKRSAPDPRKILQTAGPRGGRQRKK